MSSDLLSSLLGNLWSVLLIVLFFGGSIFVHELGHFLAARRRGVKVTRFSIGFGPKICSWQGRDGVEYRLSWLPLGGYVALPQLAAMGGIEGGDDHEAAPPAPISYATKMIVFAAGAFCNVLFALTLACILWIAGQPTSEDLSTTRIGYVSDTLHLPDGRIVPSPAKEAGLRVGDIIRKVDGAEVRDWSELLQTLVTGSGVTDDGRRRTLLTIERDGQSVDLPVYPQLAGPDEVRRVGIMAAYTPILAVVPPDSFAAKIGLKQNDELVSINGAPLLNVMPIIEQLDTEKPAEFRLGYQRDGQAGEIIVPTTRPAEMLGVLGAAIRTKVGLIHPNPLRQIADHVHATFRVLGSLLHPRSDINVSKLSGPLGIGKVFWDASEAGLRYVIWIAILVNINLAIFNLLPIPVLDGGHMLFATIARLRGRALPSNFVAATQSVFIALLLTMVLYVSFFDVKRIARDIRDEPEPKSVPTKPADPTSQPAPKP